MSKHQQKQGKLGEQQALSTLSSLGVRELYRISTPTVKIPHPTTKGYFRIVYSEPVPGDIRGVLVGGRAVLAEAKTVEHNMLLM